MTVRRRETDPSALAEGLRRQFGDAPPSAIAASLGIPIESETRPVAEGRVRYLGECWFDPPRILLHPRGIAREAVRAGVPEAVLAERVIAHELYHLLTEQASSAEAECRAHAFAGELVR